MTAEICFGACDMDLVAEVEFETTKDFDCRAWIEGGRVKTQDFFRGYVLDGDFDILDLTIDGEGTPVDANEEIRIELERELVRQINYGVFD